MSDFVILVPRRDDNGWRDRLWLHCKAIWQREFPGVPIFEGYHLASEGPFNRSLAINRASHQADSWLGRPWEIALVIDSDTISETHAVSAAVEHALATGALAIGHNARLMLNRRGTEMLLGGTSPSGLRRQYISKTYYDSISCAVAVRRDTWDMVGGFDERFVGWGFEDTAFRIAAETLTGQTIHVEQANCVHLWHESSPEASHYAPTFSKNMALKLRYERAHWDKDRILAAISGVSDPGANRSSIPQVIHRTVPAETSEQIEQWWNTFSVLHPTWELRTWRDPLDPADFPITGHLLDRCANGAQKAGLVRLELLVTHGGVYVDSDVECVRPLDALMGLSAFAAWEDERVVPDAVMACSPGHPAFREMLRRAVALVEGGSVDAWETGPGVSTAVLPWRDDVLLLPPGAFYPVHYKERSALGSRNQLPWVFMEHKWNHSWGTKAQKAANAEVKTRPLRNRPAPPPAKIERALPVPESAARVVAGAPGPALGIDLRIAICIPWRDTGDTWRRDAKKWCLEWWDYGDFKVYLGAGESRAAMCNDAAAKALADGAQVLVFADADTWGSHAAVLTAAYEAHSSGQLVHAFTSYTRVDSGRSRMGVRTPVQRVKESSLARAGRVSATHVSGLTVVSVALWRDLGGFDERFVGWGFEDQAFHLAADVIGGGHARVGSVAIHWHHRPDPTKQDRPGPEDPRVLLMQEYCKAAGRVPANGRVGRLGAAGVIRASGEPSVESMRGVLSGPGGPRTAPVVVD